MGELRLIAFVPDDVRTDEIYNPTDVVLLRAPLDSVYAQKLGVNTASVLLIEKMNGGQVKIIRRKRWPMSTEDFAWLVSTGNGDGDGIENSVLDLGDNSQFFGGTPWGITPGEMGARLLLIALGLLILLND